MPSSNFFHIQIVGLYRPKSFSTGLNLHRPRPNPVLKSELAESQINICLPCPVFPQFQLLFPITFPSTYHLPRRQSLPVNYHHRWSVADDLSNKKLYTLLVCVRCMQYFQSQVPYAILSPCATFMFQNSFAICWTFIDRTFLHQVTAANS